MNLSLDEASDQHNQLLYDVENRHRRHKIRPDRFDNERDRKRRKCPNGDNVRKYRNSLPKHVIKNFNWVVFKSQIELAREEGLISDRIDVIVDNHDEWYYGTERFPDNPYITGGYNGPG